MLFWLSRLLCLLPYAWSMRLAHAFANLWFYAIRLRRPLAEAQVARSLGLSRDAKRRRQIVKGAFENACLYAVEELLMPDLTAARSEALVARDGIERIDALLARGQGVVAVTAHVGNFELLGSSQTVRGYPISAVLKDISYAPAQRFWDHSRTQTRLGQIAPRNSRDVIRQELAENRIVAFLIDQHMAPYRSVVCHFFGQLAATSPAPVRFAMESGAPIMPLFIERTDRWGRHVIRFGEEFVLAFPSDDPAYNLWFNTQRLTTLIETWVRERPEQWLWMHRRWKVDRDSTGYDTRWAEEALRREAQEESK